MNFSSPQKKSTWPRQAAIVVSDSPNVHMLLRELLRSYGWTVIDSTPSLETAQSLVRTGQAYLVITDDTIPLPSVRHIRALLADPITCCTPVLSFLLDVHKHDALAIGKLGRPQLVDKPLTPSKFVPGFINLVRTWEREPYHTLRRVNYSFMKGNETASMRLLLKLTEQPEIQHFAAQAAALHLRRQGKLKDAEGALLASLKRTPRDLGTIVALADLYMAAAMPKLAHRLLLGARATYGQATAMIPDMVQAALMLGQIDDAVASLGIVAKTGAAPDDMLMILARLLVAEGREAEAERLLATNRNAFKRIQAAWLASEAQAATPAAS